MIRFDAVRTASAILATFLLIPGVSPSGLRAQSDPEASDEPQAAGREAQKSTGDGTDSEGSDPSHEKGERAADEAAEVDEAAETAEDGKVGEDGNGKEGGAAGKVWGLEALVERARTNADLVQEFKAKREEAEWKKFQAKWARGPKFGSTTVLAPVPGNADPDRFGQNLDEIARLNIGPLVRQDLNFVIPLYTFGRIRTLKKLADVGIDVADLKEREAKLNVIFQTKRAYYSLQLSRTYEELLKDGDTKIEKQLQEMESARDFGEADFETKDLRKLQIFATEVDERIADNEKLESIATDGLQYLTEIESEHPRVGKLDETSEPPPLEPASVYVEAATRHRPQVAQLKDAIRARQLQVNLEKQQFYPNLAFTFNFGFSWSTEETARQPVCFQEEEGGSCENVDNLFARPDNDPLSRLSFGAGLVLRWKVDPLVQRGKLGERRAQLRALKAQKRRAMGAIKLDVRRKYQDAADALEKIEIRARRLEAARRWRDQLGLALETAGTEFEDLEEEAIKPLKAYYQAKAKYLEARYNYFVARAALAQAVGVEYLSRVEADGSVDGTVPIEAPSKKGNSNKSGE